jgi:phosphoribosylanthranilate isomerase
MIVKICGIKTLAEALAALDAGADLLGFNFYPPSPRYLEPEDCVRIMSTLRATGKKVTAVGVFVNEEPQRVREILEICALDLAQLSGDEPPASLAALNGCAFKAVRPSSLAEAENFLNVYARHAAPALLVDAHVKGAYGGTGEISNWAIARHLSAQAPVLLAGGLTSQNVGAAIRAVQPWGVDVASGVESSPGVKDAARISDFIAAVREHEKIRN